MKVYWYNMERISCVQHQESRYRLTRQALLWMSAFNEPFQVLLSLVSFIMCKDLGASAWQITALVVLRPVAAFVSFYWSSYVVRRRQSLKSNLIASGVLARIPSLLIWFFDCPGFLLFAVATYMLFSRAGTPAWMEILKINMPDKPRKRLFSLSTMLGYAEGTLIGLGMGVLLDVDSSMWRILFVVSALLGLLGVFLQQRIPLPKSEEEDLSLPPIEKCGMLVHLVQPWKDSWYLLRTHVEFGRFQWGFTMGGAGLMLMMAVTPFFLVDVLALSHTSFSAARAICMAIGVVCSSPIWSRVLGLYPMNSLTGIVNLLFALFPAALLLAMSNISWLYIAYFLYGLAQGGSHIIWHLSGTIFAGNQESSAFTGVNVVMLGLRGMVFPFLGSLLGLFWGPIPVLVLGMLFCLSGAVFMLSPVFSGRKAIEN